MNRWHKGIAIASSGVALGGGGALVGNHLGEQAAQPYEDQAHDYLSCSEQVTPHTRIQQMPRLCPGMVKLDYVSAHTNRIVHGPISHNQIVSATMHPLAIAAKAKRRAYQKLDMADALRKDGTSKGLSIGRDAWMIGVAGAGLISLSRRHSKLIKKRKGID